jgi:Protein of unknown function (DUF2865)
MRGWRPGPSGLRAVSRPIAGLALLAAVAAAGALLLDRPSGGAADAMESDTQPARLVPVVPVPVVTGELRPSADWLDFLFGGVRQPRPRRTERPKQAEGASRTLCVRLCDGFYFPISYSTARERFTGDASQCERQCPDRSRLFVYRNPGEDIEDMRDLKGLAYRSLPTAFLYRSKYVADCTCRGNPWDEAERERHRAYALGGQRKLARKLGDKR